MLSVDAHRRDVEVGFLRCAREAGEMRREEDDRIERTQLRAADWQDNDMMEGGGRYRLNYNGTREGYIVIMVVV